MPHALFNAPVPTNEPIRAYGPGSLEKRELKSELARQRQTPIEIPLVIDGKHIIDNMIPIESHNALQTGSK